MRAPSLQLLLLPLVAAAAAAAPLCVTSADGSLAACVDAATGLITSLAPRGVGAPWATNASTALGAGATRAGAAAVSQQPGGAISIVQRWCFAPGGGAPPGACANVTDTLSARASSVRWHVSVAGDAAAPWSVPIETLLSFGLAQSQALKAWAPWDRGSAGGWSASWVDPLQPSDVLPGGWWEGTYRLGNCRDGNGDFIVAPLATVLSADPDALDAGVSVHLAPTDVPMDTHLLLHGNEGGLTFSRAHHRISSFAPVELDLDLVGHQADWRAALAWSVAAWPQWWEPHNPEVFATSAGTGSYSWWLGSLDQTPSYESMAYKVNWDLSGRFFPCAFLRVPPGACGWRAACARARRPVAAHRRTRSPASP